MRSYSKQQEAVALGQVLGSKGLPVIVNCSPPYRVLLGFVNNSEELENVACSIIVEGNPAKVVEAQVNSVSYKFDTGDTYAAETIAPFLGKVSFSLEKGLALYHSTKAVNQPMLELKPKFKVLAEELDILSQQAVQISEEAEDIKTANGMTVLSERCFLWAESLRKAAENWEDSKILVSQQQALALLEDYHHFLAGTN